MSFAATTMDLETIMLREDIPYDITYMWNLQHGTDKLVYETDSQTQKSNLRLPKGKGSEGMDKLNV